ncbi:TPA: hypothetical protein VB881_000150 [Streptococcus suis]|nr:hypothetical protein [Streptococcus suis]
MDYRFIKGSSPRLLVFFHGTGGNKESMLFLHQQLDLEAPWMEVGVKAGKGVSLLLWLMVSWDL